MGDRFKRASVLQTMAIVFLTTPMFCRVEPARPLTATEEFVYCPKGPTFTHALLNRGKA